MVKLFPEPIRNLPEASVPIQGVKAFLSQGDSHQVLFMEFKEDADLQEHSHKAQWGIVIDGDLDLIIGGVKGRYKKGQHYFIPDGVKHSGHIYAGLVVVEYFDQKDRFSLK
jgi:quercetin dioxygenase-like cupin family protein